MDPKEMRPPASGGMGMPPMMQEMMQKMMGGTKDFNPMAMCQAMMTSVSRSAELAAYATPEVRTLFEEWGQEVEREMMDLLTRRGPISLEALAAALKISQTSALIFLGKLVQQGKATIGDIRPTSAIASA